MKKNNKLSTAISVLIIIFMFAIAIVIVIAGYNFLEGFSLTGGEENTMKTFISAIKGLSTIAIGIFILILVGILVYDNSIRELRETLQLGLETIFGIQSRVLSKEEEIKEFLENKIKMSTFVEENELLRKEISAKNDNIKGLLYKLEALEEECSTFEEKVQKLQEDIKTLKNKNI